VNDLDKRLIEDSITLAALCAACIIEATGMPLTRLHDALPRLIGALRVASLRGACGACLRQKIVHRLVATHRASGRRGA
jgi:hypothetical protein